MGSICIFDCYVWKEVLLCGQMVGCEVVMRLIILASVSVFVVLVAPQAYSKDLQLSPEASKSGILAELEPCLAHNDLLLSQRDTHLDVQPQIDGVYLEKDHVAVLENVFDQEMRLILFDVFASRVFISDCRLVRDALLVAALMVFFFLLENELCLAMPEACEVIIRFLKTLSNLSQEVVDIIVFIDIDNYYFGSVLDPTRLNLVITCIVLTSQFLVHAKVKRFYRDAIRADAALQEA